MSFNDAVVEVSRKFQRVRFLSPSPIPMGEGRGEGSVYDPLTLTLSPTKTWWRGDNSCPRSSRFETVNEWD